MKNKEEELLTVIGKERLSDKERLAKLFSSFLNDNGYKLESVINNYDLSWDLRRKLIFGRFLGSVYFKDKNTIEIMTTLEEINIIENICKKFQLNNKIKIIIIVH